uniref:Uncharacterized protein n=1 Tax=Periophthalmus magnuspinnatus TaxID=409849 RepID=A0A3B4A435_9GOBI
GDRTCPVTRVRPETVTVSELNISGQMKKRRRRYLHTGSDIHSLWVGRLLVYSSIFYLVTSLLVYCVFLPERWLQRCTLALPFFTFPVVVWFIRKLLIFLFSKRTESNSKSPQS